MQIRKPIDGQAALLMMVLCAVWGLQQVVIKLASADIAPVLQIALRSGFAAIMVAVVLLVRRRTLRGTGNTWRPGLLVGLFFALEYLAVAEGLRHTSAAHMVIFLYAAPIFAAIGLHYRFASERLTALQWAGILVAFAGVALAFYAPAATDSSTTEQRLGDGLGLLGAMLWGATTITVRCSRLADTPAPLTLFYQLVSAFVILTLMAWASGQTHLHLSSIAWAAMAYQTLVVSFFSFLAWFWLLGHYLGSRLGVLSFLTPLFGVGFGFWLLDESLEPSFIVGALLVCTGIVLVSGHDLLRESLRRRALIKN